MLEIKHLGKTYGTGAKATHAVGDVSFAVDDGRVRLRRRAVRLRQDDAAEVHRRACCGRRAARCCCAARRVTGPPEQMALVFQEYSRSLMPWTSVRNNVLLPLRHKKLRRSRARRGSSRRRSARSGSTRFIDHYPWQLSGGMQQRVAIARALAYQPSILLMDEPFASVDAQTRGDLEDLVLRVRDEFGITILFVTHDIDESVYLSDRVVVLTHAPTEVKEVVPVDLPRPRDQIATKELPEFARLRAPRLPADQARAGRRGRRPPFRRGTSV